jgi:hypothetical protein
MFSYANPEVKHMSDIKFQRSLKVLINNINQSQTDSLKMRYILDFFDRIFRKGYMQEGFSSIYSALVSAGYEIVNQRDLQMYKVLIYYLSLKNNEYIPNYVESPIIYDLPHRPHNIELSAKNIFVCDESFR